MHVKYLDSSKINEVLSWYLSSQGYHWQAILLANWHLIMGPLKNIVRIYKIENDILILSVISPAWAIELKKILDKLKQKINQILGFECIRTIKFVTK